jgi:CelD/BcsL family acetyltransferase involved in cellulose biosynthesis
VATAATSGFAQEWDALADRSGVPPWFRPGWFAAWAHAFAGPTAAVFAIRGQAGELLAVAPVVRRRGVLRAAANWHTPEFGVCGKDAAAVVALLRALFSQRPRRIDIAFVDRAGSTAAALAELCPAAGYRVLSRTIERSPYLELTGGWQRYHEALDGRVRREIARRQRRLDERGGLQLDVQDGSRGLDVLLEQGFRVEASGWKGSSGTAIASKPQTRDFYSEIARWAAARGWLRLAFLRVGGQPVAFDLALQTGGAHFLLKTGYDPDFRGAAPGVLLRHLMIKRAFAEGLGSYEFLGTESSWKATWTQTSRARLRVQAFAPTPVGRADRLAFRFGMPVARRIMSRVRR